MPAYDYKCKTCGEVFEITRSASDTAQVGCPGCGGDTKRVFSPVGVVFKGSGFYTTDSKGRSAVAKKPEGKPAPCPAKESGACSNCPAAE